MSTTGTAFARTVLDMAAQIEAAETAIKHELLRAAEAGDSARVREIVTRWLEHPPTEVLGKGGGASEAA